LARLRNVNDLGRVIAKIADPISMSRNGCRMIDLRDPVTFVKTHVLFMVDRVLCFNCCRRFATLPVWKWGGRIPPVDTGGYTLSRLRRSIPTATLIMGYATHQTLSRYYRSIPIAMLIVRHSTIQTLSGLNPSISNHLAGFLLSLAMGTRGEVAERRQRLAVGVNRR